MTPLAALVVVYVLVQQPQNALDTAPDSAVERLDSLRCLLLQRDREAQKQVSICSTPPVILGQWRN
jgi:hypothetical protein